MPRYIDADAIMKQLARKKAGPANKRYTEGFNDALMSFRSMVHSAPTISPDEVRGVGKWIWHDNYGWDDSLECSCCAKEFVVYDGEFPGINSFKFCPNCGVRMKGAEDGTTD